MQLKSDKVSNKPVTQPKNIGSPYIGGHTFNRDQIDIRSRFNRNNTAAEQFDILHFNKTKEEIQFEKKVKESKEQLDLQINDYEEKVNAFEKELKRLRETLQEGKEKSFEEGKISRETLETPTTINPETGKSLETPESLDSIVQEMGFDNYSQFEEYMNYLETNKATFENAIYKLEQEKKQIEYEYLMQEESFRKFTKERKINKEEVLKEFTHPSEVMDSRSDFVEEYNKTHEEKISAFELYEILKENHIDYGVTKRDEEEFADLVEASKTNPNLANMYNYLYVTEGKEKANQYLEDTRDTINQLAGEQKAKKFLDSLKDDPEGLEKLKNHLKVGGKGLGDGIESFVDGLEAWFASDEVRTSDEYESMYLLQALASEEEKEALGLITEGKSSSSVIDYTENYGKLLDWNYKLNQGIGNMLPAIALSTINPTLGSVSLGVSSGGSAYHSAIVEGYSTQKAVLYGIFSGASDAILEKAGGIIGLGDNPGSNFLMRMFKEGGQEAVQELFTSGVLDSILLGKTINVDELTDAMKESFIMGALVAGTINGGQNSIRLIVDGEYRTVTMEEIKDFASYMSKSNQNTLSSNGAGYFNAMFDYFIRRKATKPKKESWMANRFTEKSTQNGVTNNTTATIDTTLSESEINAKINRFNELRQIMESEDYKMYQQDVENGYATQLKFAKVEEEFNQLSNELHDVFKNNEGQSLNVEEDITEELAQPTKDLNEKTEPTLELPKVNPAEDLKVENSKFMEQANNNFLDLKNEINQTINPNYNETSKARKLYIELNKRLNYDADYIKGDSAIKQSIISQPELTFENISSNRVVCKGWSELYREILIENGFSPDKVHIMQNGQHRWVEIKLSDDNIIIADATEALNHSTDLSNCKAGLSTNGFLYASSSSSGQRLSKINPDILSSEGKKWINTDQYIGYTTNNQYYDQKILSAKKVFGNSKLFSSVFGEHILSKKLSVLENLEIPENMDGYEYYPYLRNFKYTMFDAESRSKIKVGLSYHQTVNGYEGVTTMTIDDVKAPYYMIYSKSFGKLTFNTFNEYVNFMQDNNIIR